MNNLGELSDKEVGKRIKRTVTESFHAWLIRQRRFCDRCRNTLTPAVTVRNFNGKDLVLCQTHASRIDAVRQSDNKQESKIP